MEIKPGEVWQGHLLLPDGGFRVTLYRHQFWDDGWSILGAEPHGFSCGKLLPWATGGMYFEDELPLCGQVKGPTSFQIELDVRVETETRPAPEYVHVKKFPLRSPCVITFNDVHWKSAGHTSNDSICSGRATFNCQSFFIHGVVWPDLPEPIIVEGKS